MRKKNEEKATRCIVEILFSQGIIRLGKMFNMTFMGCTQAEADEVADGVASSTLTKLVDPNFCRFER